MESRVTEGLSLVDKYFSPTVRRHIEEAFYEKINHNARLSNVINDPVFLAHPFKHVAFSTDHGLVHVRDIAMRVLVLLDELNGVHFSKRSPSRLGFMKGYGAMLAYVHDVGMIDIKSVEHDNHAELSAEMMYNDFFDKQVALLWEENSGNVAWRITQLAFKKAITQPPHLVLREMLVLAGAHRKETVPVDTLNHPGELRRQIQEMVAESKLLKIFYEDFKRDSFSWLVSENQEVRELVQDVIDTLRVLRCANACRQRGERLRATGGFQIFLDHHTANAIYAINADEKLLLMESKDTLLSGEVNLSGTEFTHAGDLRISFYRGSFDDDKAVERAVFNAALAINEVQGDVIGSFSRPPAGEDNASGDYSKKWKPVYILLENSDDNESFAQRVKDQLIILNPSLKETIRVVPSLQNATESERNRYLLAEELNWDLKTQKEMLEKISQSGHKVSSMQPQKAFTDVKCSTVNAGDMLIQAGTLGSFVYIPLAEGLVGYPLGGYEPFHAHQFIPLGNVGIIRGDTRNSTIVAETSLKVLMIPKEVYLDAWHHTYTEDEFAQMLKNKCFQ
ncbi:MAG TPA: hypothetical protein VGV92_09195 [Gammaproteobacteria bacterium]|nr:hypothetical protein [Gammaproteobacteria bacterium]